MDEINKKLFYSGTSGLVLPFPNKQSFPPEFQHTSRLKYYSSLFSSVEINSSFYKIPMEATVKKWAADVSEDFRFTFKLWKEITHCKALQYKLEDIDRFMTVISNVEEKKGCLLVQFPPGLTMESFSGIELLLERIKKSNPGNQWKVCVEFRNPSWYNDDTIEMLYRQQSTLVYHDHPRSATPLNEVPNLIYLRFHGPNGGYRGVYTDDFLYEYSLYIKEWIEEGKKVYAYFNNTIGGAVHNLLTLNKFVSSESNR